VRLFKQYFPEAPHEVDQLQKFWDHKTNTFKSLDLSILTKMLSKMPFFSRMSATTLERLLPFLHSKTFKKGEILFNDEFFQKNVGIILKGSVEVKDYSLDI
jgi:hypothetical protein